MNITFLPTPDELAYNLNQLPKNENYLAAMKSLAKSVIEYSQQISFLMDSTDPEAEEVEEEYGDKLPE